METESWLMFMKCVRVCVMFVGAHMLQAPANIHLAFQALHAFCEETGSLPQAW